MATEMYGSPLAYDLNNKESMKVVIDAFNDFMTPNKYIKVVDSEKIINQVKTDYEGKLSELNNIAKGLADNLTGIKVMLGLATNSSIEAVLADIEALKKAAPPVPMPSIPETQIINGQKWGISEVSYKKI